MHGKYGVPLDSENNATFILIKDNAGECGDQISACWEKKKVNTHKGENSTNSVRQWFASLAPLTETQRQQIPEELMLASARGKYDCGTSR